MSSGSQYLEMPMRGQNRSGYHGYWHLEGCPEGGVSSGLFPIPLPPPPSSCAGGILTRLPATVTGRLPATRSVTGRGSDGSCGEPAESSDESAWPGQL